MDFLLEALIDSAKMIPFLLIAYIAIEVIEYFSARKLHQSKLLTGKFSNLFAAGFGLIPLCSFSVVATDLFSSKKIRIGTLLAVYIATSDEAVPLLLVNPDKISSLLPLLLIKFLIALIVGYSVDLIFKKINERHLSLATAQSTTNKQPVDNHDYDKHDEHEEVTEFAHTGCCGHEIETNSKSDKFKKFFVHPLVHTLKIFAFILLANAALGGIIELVGEDSLRLFLQSSKGFAPLLSSIIGLIPNCASSVVITKLYTTGGIGFGACIAGLIVNAGISFVILFKQNKNIKQNFAILGAMLAIGITTGYIIQLIGF